MAAPEPETKTEAEPGSILPDFASLNISSPKNAQTALNPTDAAVDAVSAVPAPSNTAPPSAPKPKKVKKEKKLYPSIRRKLFADYGLSVADHFVRSFFEKHSGPKVTEHCFEYDDLFALAINLNFTHIAAPFMPKVLKPNATKLEFERVLLQVFSMRDISNGMHKVDALNTGDAPKRMLHFVLTDSGKNKINAVEYQHVMLFEFGRSLYALSAVSDWWPLDVPPPPLSLSAVPRPTSLH